jgi:hypothetical protein
MRTIYLALVVALMGGCVPDETSEFNAWVYDDYDGYLDKDCSGTLWSNGCDDCNPCTWAMWCDPVEWVGGFVPDACVSVATSGVAQCSPQFGWTTPVGQINDCFPIEPVTNVRAGRCCAGTCTDNADECAVVTPDTFGPGSAGTKGSSIRPLLR